MPRPTATSRRPWSAAAGWTRPSRRTKRRFGLRPDQTEWQFRLAQVQNDLGKAAADSGRAGEAIRHYAAALQVRPDYFDARYNLGLTLAGLRQFDAAVAQYRAALRLKPDDADAHNNLGLALASSGHGGDAMHEYREALRIKPDSAEALGNLAVAYAQSGRLPDAVAALREAVKLATRQNNQALADGLRARLAEYEGGRPAGHNPPPSADK